jgi:hypothetical protein
MSISMSSSLLERLLELPGRRADDPLVLEFHRAEQLAPPPAILDLTAQEPARSVENGYAIYYSAELLRLETWPPRLGSNGLVGYVSLIELKSKFAPHLPTSLPIDLTEEAVKTVALSRRETLMHRVYRVIERNERKLELWFWRKGGLMARRLTIDELDRKDPRLAPFTPEMSNELRAHARSIAPPPRASTRQFPPRSGPPTALPLPEVLVRLGQVLEADRVQHLANVTDEDDDLGPWLLDFELYHELPVGAFKTFSKNPEAELEFRQLGMDGAGGLVAFWLVYERPLLEQPVVFIGSEGEVKPVAKDLVDFLELLALGHGPAGGSVERAVPGVKGLLDELYPDRPPRTLAAIQKSRQAYRDITERWQELCLRYRKK